MPETATGFILLHKGAMPVDAMARASEVAGAGAVIDTDLARMAGVDFAFGPPALLEDLKARLADGVHTRTATDHPDLAADAMAWLATGERGLSSEAIFQHMTGVPLARTACDAYAHPSDPADLRRCMLLLEAVPAFAARLGEMSEVSEIWARLVAAWPELCATMDAESPNWRSGGGWAHRTYEKMRALQQPSRP